MPHIGPFFVKITIRKKSVKKGIITDSGPFGNATMRSTKGRTVVQLQSHVIIRASRPKQAQSAERGGLLSTTVAALRLCDSAK